MGLSAREWTRALVPVTPMSSQQNPYEIIEQMLERMNRQFGETTRMWESGMPEFGESGFGQMGIDLADHDEEFVVTADVPGFERDEIELRKVDETLQITAAHEEESEEKAEHYLRSEREHRSLSERVRLPEPVVGDEITATLQNGVLTITLPKAEPSAAEGHRIEIE